MNKIFVLAVVLSLFLVGYYFYTQNTENKETYLDCAEIDAQQKCILYDVSIIKLIANPEIFHGKRVRVIGYLKLKFEGDAIYLSKEDEQNGVTKNGLYVSFEPGVINQTTEYSDHYVLAEGVFNAKSHGHLGLWSGEIEKISRILVWGTT